ncbi:hypothetical protein ZOSMA_124G00250 [Zostera marina]|uniref:Pentatricopeptide repeat-containing protein n=1 Tax=Zostera marina TaxID=29655 RepID=A0A0K9Q0G0_ZOSMR|nr:hypothetical protein ZOSMA_124G00250 [Zostera marina]
MNNGSIFPGIARLRLLPRIWCRHRHSSRDYYHRRKPSPPQPPSPAILERLISKLPPRYTSDDLVALLSSERNPKNCLNLFIHAIQKNTRFKPQTSVYLITIKKLGSAKHYLAMDGVAAQALANSAILSPELMNTLIFYYSQARMLTKAVDVYKTMRDSDDPSVRPSLVTYNLLFAALLTREGNSFINHMYMENVRCLFRQMIDADIEPDILTLNAVIKGYVLSLHVNDALRVFHQMNGLVYKCPPDDETYNWIVHGLCAQGRTEMRGRCWMR